MKLRKKPLISVLVVCAIVGGVFVPKLIKSSNEETTTTQPQYTTVQRGTLSTSISASATLSMPRQTKLTFGVDGIIAEIDVDFGDIVKQGQVLAKLDTTNSLERALTQAEGNLTIAQANLDKIQNPSESTITQAQSAVTTAKANLQTAEENLDNLKNPTELSLAQARATVTKAEASLKSAQASLKTAQDPAIGDVAQATTAVNTAQLALENAQRDQTVTQKNASKDISTAENTVETQQDLYTTAISNYTLGKITFDALTDQEYALDTARTQLEITRSNAEKSVANAENAVTTAENSLLQKKIDLSDAINGVSLAMKQSTVDSAEVTLLQAQEDLNDMLDGGDSAELEAAQAKVESVRASLLAAQDTLESTQSGGDPETLISKKLQLDSAQAAVDTAKENIEEATITALYDGIIAASVSVKVGDSVSSGTTIMQLVDATQIEIEASIDEVDVFNVEVGQEVNVSFEYLTDLTLTGEVKAISPLATSSSGVVSYAVLISLDEIPTDTKFYEGLTSTLDIITAKSENALLIPSKAITTTRGVKTVPVMVNGVAQIRTITIGLTNGTQTEVTSGLTEGEQILVSSTISSSTSSTTSATATATTSQQSGPGILGGLTGGGGPPSGGGPPGR